MKAKSKSRRKARPVAGYEPGFELLIDHATRALRIAEGLKAHGRGDITQQYTLPVALTDAAMTSQIDLLQRVLNSANALSKRLHKPMESGVQS